MAKTEETATDNDEDEPDGKNQRVQLDWKDYVALAIAGLETIILPMVILIIILFALVLIVR